MVELLDALANELSATKTDVLYQALQCLHDRQQRAERLPGGGSLTADGKAGYGGDGD